MYAQRMSPVAASGTHGFRLRVAAPGSFNLQTSMIGQTTMTPVDSPTTPPPPPPPAPPLLKLDDVGKTYHMGEVSVEVLKHVSLDIRDGEVLAVLGPSGSGKSTLLNLIGGLDRASHGR